MSYHKVRRTLMLLSIATIAIASTAFAQVSGTFRVSFGTSPRWEPVQGTQVYVVRDVDRPNYDVFRYGNTYYVYSNDRWYSSQRMNGDFIYITDDRVPNQLSMVPRERWVSYPSRWSNNDPNDYSHRNRNDNDRYDNSGSFRVSFNTRPSWEVVRGTGVRVIRSHDRPDYDMFQYRGNYYVYSGGNWYMSRRWRGDFQLVESSRVPHEFRRVPRRYWREYAWSNGYYGGRQEDRGGYRR